MLYKSRNKLYYYYYSGDYRGCKYPACSRFRKYVCIINVVFKRFKISKIIMKKHYLIACILFVVSSVQAQLPNFYTARPARREGDGNVCVEVEKKFKQSDSLVWSKVETDTPQKAPMMPSGSSCTGLLPSILQKTFRLHCLFQQFAALFRVLPFQPKENKNSGNGLDVIISMNALHLRPTG